jgi:hypothetical protein
VLPPKRKKQLAAAGAGALVIAAVAIAIAARGTRNDSTPPEAPKLATVTAPTEAAPAAGLTAASPPPAPVQTPQPAVNPSAPSKPASPGPRKPATLGGKRVVVEYDNSATHHAEAAAATSAPEDEAAIGKARALYNTGNQRLFAGDANGAVQAYRSALDAFPGYVAGYRGLGLAYMQLGSNGDAVKALQTYVRAAPSAKDVVLIKKRITHLEHL